MVSNDEWCHDCFAPLCKLIDGCLREIINIFNKLPVSNQNTSPVVYNERARAFVRANVSLRALYSTSLATRIPALSQSRPFTQYPISKLRYPSQIELLVHTFIGRRINQNKQTISMIRWNAKNADRKLKTSHTEQNIMCEVQYNKCWADKTISVWNVYLGLLRMKCKSQHRPECWWVCLIVSLHRVLRHRGHRVVLTPEEFISHETRVYL